LYLKKVKIGKKRIMWYKDTFHDHKSVVEVKKVGGVYVMRWW